LFLQIAKTQMVKGKSGKAPFPLLKFRVRSGNFRNLIVELVQNADGDVKNFLTHLTIRSRSAFRSRSPRSSRYRPTEHARTHRAPIAGTIHSVSRYHRQTSRLQLPPR